jgi:serine/threonine-protein phosphatase 2A regulatory subunit B'
VPAPPPKGGSVPSSPAYQGSLKSNKDGSSSSSSSSNSLSTSRGSAVPSHVPYSNAGYPSGQGTPERRVPPSGVNHLADKTPPAPPVVVVSTEMPADPIPHSVATAAQPSSSVTPFHHTGSPGSPPPPGAAMASLSSAGIAAPEFATPPKVGTLNRLRQGPSTSTPKDTIPITSKTPPRKQRSSRFHVTEKVELEKLPHFNGTYPRRFSTPCTS